MPEQQYMQLALELAAKAVGRTTPNPPVGAVVVYDGNVVGRGYHPEAGKPHAEIFALEEAGTRAENATLYVTLEPCNHQGRTGPCTEAIIKAGIRRVVVGATDPNPLVSGTGIERLKEAGISVDVGILADECRELIAPFAKHVTTGLPLVTLKMAMTLDGQTATSTGDSRWISNEESRLHVHRMRDRSDAIMVGIETVLADDPQLTTRLPEGGHDPVRVVVDSNLRLPLSARVLTIDSVSGLMVVTTDKAAVGRIAELEKAGAEVVVVSAADGQVDLQEMVAELGRRGIQSILLEGGASLAAAALRQCIVDRVAIFIAPKLLGGSDGKMLFNGPGLTVMNEAINLKNTRVSHFGDDILVEGEVA